MYNRFRVFENRALKRISGSKREEAKGNQLMRSLQNYALRVTLLA
jgi:hypothetical protein